jgi:putative transposase
MKLLYVANSKNPLDFKYLQGLSLSEIDRGETLVEIGVYCLMPNHFHLLVREKIENGISFFMKRLLTAYSMYFNKKYEHSGRLFQNVYQAKHTDEDIYLRHLFAYIHLNPIKLLEPKWRTVGVGDHGKAIKFLQRYLFSSYLDYQEVVREEKLILSRKVFPEYFSSPSDFNDFVNDGLSFKDSP